MRYSLDILHILTKPVVEPAFLQDWLAFLSREQDFAVHLIYSPDAFPGDDQNPALMFPDVQLYRIEKVSPYPARAQALVFLSDLLDLGYLSKAITPALVHSHDTRSLLLSRYFYAEANRLHSWWLDDRTAHRYWKASIERLAGWRTWETVEDDPHTLTGAMSPAVTRQYPLPTPVTFEENPGRGRAFTTMREIYRTILRNVDIRSKAL